VKLLSTLVFIENIRIISGDLEGNRLMLWRIVYSVITYQTGMHYLSVSQKYILFLNPNSIFAKK